MVPWKSADKVRGFKDWVYKQYGFDLYGDTVAAQWNHKENWCIKGTIGMDPIPQNVLVDVFIKKDGTWTHTGFYYNGETCECSVNVQHFNPMKKDRWTHWAIAACFKSGWTMPEKEPAKEEPVETVKTLKKGSKGAAVKELQQRLLDAGLSDRGIIAADTFDVDNIRMIYGGYDNLTALTVTMETKP